MIQIYTDFCIFLFLRYSQPPPVLQSVWFIPHVAAYFIAYLLMGGAVVLAVVELCNARREKSLCALWLNRTVKAGTFFLGIGLCLGAIWAKKAWGLYWSWDIKETFALITWGIFLLYLHLQKIKNISRKILCIIVIIGFSSLLFTWFGVNYLPSAQKSPHTFYGVK